jgi:hypothetical protein
MKNILIYILLFGGCSRLNAQTKKEKIIMLSATIDSLSNVVAIERNNYFMNQEIKNNIIEKCKSEINKKNDSLIILNKELEVYSAKIDFLVNELTRMNELIQRMKESRDSIKQNSQNIDKLIWEFPENMTWNVVEFNLKLPFPKSKYNVFTGSSDAKKMFISKDQKILITFDYNHTDWTDYSYNDGQVLFGKRQDAIKYFSKNLQNVEISENEGFIIKGKNTSNQSITIKGIYNELYSMQGRDEGEPTWLWSNTLIIKITAEEDANDHDYEQISHILIDSFSEKSIFYKYDY